MEGEEEKEEEEGPEQQQKLHSLEEGAEATLREVGGKSPTGGRESSDTDINANTNIYTNISLMEKQKEERLSALLGLVVIAAGEVLGVRCPDVMN